jgi:hypothetical protein
MIARLMRFVTMAWVILCVLPAKACINDGYSANAEAEFRSRYETVPGKPAVVARKPSWPGYAAMVVGGGLVAGSLMTAAVRHKRRSVA